MSQQHLLAANIIKHGVTVEWPAKPQIPPEAKGFIELCLKSSVEERPDASTLLAHPFLDFSAKPKPDKSQQMAPPASKK